MRRLISIAAAMVLLVPVQANADSPLTAKSLNSRFASNRVFFLNQDSIPVSSSPAGGHTTKNTAMGELYFARAEDKSAGAVNLGKYNVLQRSFTEDLGWVKTSYLVESIDPLTVGEAVNAGILDSSLLRDASTSYSDANTLFLRAVSKPETKLSFARKPGEKGKAQAIQYTWYYVFGFQKVGTEIWYLLGKDKELLNTKFPRDTNDDTAKTRLLGWVRQRDVKEWCSNTVFEYNAEEAAVRERYRPSSSGGPGFSNKPGKIFSTTSIGKPAPTSKDIAAVEPLEMFWRHRFDSSPSMRMDKSLADFDPIGFSPTIPRLHVLEADKTKQRFRVATLGSVDGSISPSEIARIFDDLQRSQQFLRMVDIAFVIDATGSMGDEIDVVRSFLDEVCKRFKAEASKGDAIRVERGGRTELFDSSMDIAVSLVAYQDIGASNSSSPFNTRVIVPNLRLKEYHYEIVDSFKKLTKENLGGATEALHDGLVQAVSNRRLWRDQSAVRVVIVIGDEAGDLASGETRSDAQKRVLREMMLPPGVASTSSRLDEYRRAYTTIYGIYTNSELFQNFKNNLSELVEDASRQIIHAPNFVDDSNRRGRLVDILYERIGEAQTKMAGNVRRMAQGLFSEKRPSTAGAPTAAIMQELAIHQAMDSAGVSNPESLLKITKVAFTEGWVYEKQSDHKFPTFRARVALSSSELRELYDSMEMMSVTLKSILDGAGPLSRIDPDLVIYAALVTVIEKFSGEGEEERDLNQLIKAAKRLRSDLDNSQAKDLRSYLNIRASLPIADGGLLGMPIERLRSLSLDDLLDQVEALQRKKKCIRNVIAGETAPEDFNLIEQHVAKAKDWSQKHPESGVNYYYVPVSYLPGTQID